MLDLWLSKRYSLLGCKVDKGKAVPVEAKLSHCA
jgi:hypothetical protein